MGEEQVVHLLWEYYKETANLMGRKKSEVEEIEAVELQYPQDNFSLLWVFLEQDSEHLNSLTRAYLMDQTAMEALDWNEEVPENWVRFTLEGRALNDAQREAVQRALTAPFSFVQGPPGTGKTETILNLASCAARMGRTVAIVSSNKAALDNIREKIQKFAQADGSNERWLYQHFARLGNGRDRTSFEDFQPEVSEDDKFKFKENKKEIATWADKPVTVQREPSIQAENFLARYPIVACTIHSLKNCFVNGPDYVYDYVIMDEASQTAPLVGLVAMSAARHLVLVGDQKQLPPVSNGFDEKKLRALTEERGWTIPAVHLPKVDRSFLDICREVFRGRAPETVLRYHYRCHPGIIQFCIQEVYQDEGLEICTRGWDTSVETPIKILWFKGDYCERCSKSANSELSSKRNQKQILCFMEEEWPQLRQRLQADNPPSVCILSPFRGQLQALDDALKEEDQQFHFVLEGVEDAGAGPKPPMLTIHKSQGQQFDIVYLLPVEDGDWEWPWSQHKRLINVAVSRAVKELRVILSSTLMDRELQKELTGQYIPPSSRGASPEEASDQRYLQKLVRYVWDRWTGKEPDTRYGFHRSKRDSIFDQKCWKRIERLMEVEGDLSEESGRQTDAWAPESCMEAALVEIMREIYQEHGVPLTLCKDVSLRDIRDREGRDLFQIIPQEDRELRNMVDYGHFDFVLCRDSRILMVVEVDGSYHRAPGRDLCVQERRDETKNRLVEEYMGGIFYKGTTVSGEQNRAEEDGFVFIRIPDDGRTCLETRALWNKADPELQNRYFPLEDLLEPQLSIPDADLGFHIPMRSISELVLDWDMSPGNYRRAEQRLEDYGLLDSQHYCSSLGKICTMPTDRGRNWVWGITQVIHFDSRGELFCRAFYPERIQGKILDLLENGPSNAASVSLTADMPVGAILPVVFHWLEGCCDLHDPGVVVALNERINFQGSHPDYKSHDTQALYLLRYLYGYAFEYKQMYRKLLDNAKGSLGERITVTSIGCGNMVDYWALHAILTEARIAYDRLDEKKRKRAPEPPGGIDYTGVDLNPWSEAFRIQAGSGDQVRFACQDAVYYLQNQVREGCSASDVYVFPKSISDFDGGETEDGPTLRLIREGLRDLLLQSPQKRVWLLFSLRSNKEDGLVYSTDLANCGWLQKSVEESGFHLVGKPRFCDGTPNISISKSDRDFTYPGYILGALRARGAEGARMPVLKTKYMRYQILAFERG